MCDALSTCVLYAFLRLNKTQYETPTRERGKCEKWKKNSTEKIVYALI